MPQAGTHPAARYAAAVFLTAVALLLTLLSGSVFAYTPSLFMFAAVVVCAWYGGFGPAAVSTVLGGLAFEFFVRPPEFGWAGGESVSRIGAFVALGLLIGWLGRQQQADHSEDLLGAVVASCRDAVLVVGLDGTVVAWNPAAERLYGYGDGEMLGRHASMLFAPQEVASAEVARARVFRGEPMEPYECLQRTREGDLVPVELTLSPVFDRGQTLAGLSMIVRPTQPADRHRSASSNRS
ncbi:MAG: PAS domain S-box protein [Acidobacteriota bacterium]|nr:PAS domain S-box protein [Acidobacteriota bacterium]